MTIFGRAMQVAGLGVTIGLIGFAVPASSQQPPPATGAPTQPAPMQPGPGMGQQMRQQGMEHGRMGQGMGQKMREREMGKEQPAQTAPPTAPDPPATTK